MTTSTDSDAKYIATKFRLTEIIYPKLLRDNVRVEEIRQAIVFRPPYSQGTGA